MRRSLGLLGLTLALTAPLAPGAPAAAAAAPLDCTTVITGVDADQHVVGMVTEDGRVTDSERSHDALPFDPTGLVYRGTEVLRRGYTLILDAAVPGGVVREVRVTDKDRTDGLGLETGPRFRNTRFAPRLFAASFGTTVYTVDGDVLHRWFRKVDADGRLRYGGRSTLPAATRRWTALQYVGTFDVRGVRTEYLVATTDAGALKLVRVPFRQQQRTSVRTLATEGYAGVTELSAGTCDGSPSRVVLTAIDAAAGTATWTTVRDIRRATRDTTRLRGAVTGADTWALHAVF
ncbi:MAG TPA: hypothetical protein VD864_01235 [Nocardioides sp.]|nr:hypothetical protein [Nocardioides sp.]